MKVLYVRRMMWYVHERRTVIFDGQPPSRSIYMLSISLAESAVVRTKVWLRKKPIDLCVCESEEHDHEKGAGVNTTLLSDTL
jgi:hypothetical protein